MFVKGATVNTYCFTLAWRQIICSQPAYNLSLVPTSYNIHWKLSLTLEAQSLKEHIYGRGLNRTDILIFIWMVCSRCAEKL